MRLADITKHSLKARVLYLDLISHMAQVDGTLDQVELEHLHALLQAFDVPEKYHAKIIAKSVYEPQEIAAAFEDLKQRKLHYSFFLDLMVMAMADGVLQEEEKRFLAQIRNLLQVPAVDFHNLINFAQTTGSLDLNLVIDPMYSYVIDGFFNWARQGQVKLYHQTAFALNPKVDAHLKANL